METELTRLRVPKVSTKPQSVFVVMAIESLPGKNEPVAPELGFDCYAVANSYATASAIIAKDVERGDLVAEPKPYVVEYPIETPETV